MTRTFEETIYVKESAFTVSFNFWIFDLGASQHICNSLQGLTGSRTLHNGEMIRRVGNDTKISVCGPVSTTSRGGFSYYITFTDDYSQFGYVYLMKYNSESFEKFKEFKNEVEKQTGKQIKILRSNRGGEYGSNEFLDYLKECGIISQWTPPGTP
ncbi:hypothetical protein EV2_000013 [Malus domestica]